MLTESEIFLSNCPKPLLQAEENSADTYLSELYRKYRRIDLIKWDPDLSGPFYDYVLDRVISLQEFNDLFNKYSPLALRRLKGQLEMALNRWGNQSQFENALLRIEGFLNKILETSFIFERFSI